MPFGPSTAQRLVKIARDNRLIDRSHVNVLPPDWGTLYEITKLSDAELEAAFDGRVIKPDMRRQDAETGLHNSREVNEDFTAAVVGLDESIAYSRIEPFHGA